VADIVAARAQVGKNYGVILIPEGLLEHVPEVPPCRPTLDRAARRGARALCRGRGASRRDRARACGGLHSRQAVKQSC